MNILVNLHKQIMPHARYAPIFLPCTLRAIPNLIHRRFDCRNYFHRYRPRRRRRNIQAVLTGKTGGENIPERAGFLFLYSVPKLCAASLTTNSRWCSAISRMVSWSADNPNKSTGSRVDFIKV